MLWILPNTGSKVGFNNHFAYSGRITTGASSQWAVVDNELCHPYSIYSIPGDTHTGFHINCGKSHGFWVDISMRERRRWFGVRRNKTSQKQIPNGKGLEDFLVAMDARVNSVSQCTCWSVGIWAGGLLWMLLQHSWSTLGSPDNHADRW